MADKHNYKELLGARLEAIHMEETKAQNLPTEEDMFRWEKLAAARRAEKKRHMRTLTSIAAAVLFIFAVGITIIIGPPNAEAGGDGEVVIHKNDITNEKIIVKSYGSLEQLPRDVKETFIAFDLPEEYFFIKGIELTNINNYLQLTVKYEQDMNGQLEITQSHNTDSSITFEHNVVNAQRTEMWGEREIYISDNVVEETRIYAYMQGNIFVSIKCDDFVEEERVKEIVKEAL